MKYFLLSFSLLLAIFPSYSQTSNLIMSSIGAQEVYEGARITVYFSSLKHFTSIAFTSDDLPSFGTIINDGNGDGRITFDPTQSDIGEYTINLRATSGNHSNRSTFHLIVRAIPDDAIVYHLDPINGDENNPGTAAEPLPSLETVIANNLVSINSNTYLFLRNGYHGSAFFQGSYNSPVHVLAERNNDPLVKNMVFFFANNWYVSNLHVSPENFGINDEFILVKVNPGCDKIRITNCKLYNIDDASVWTSNEDWYQGCTRGWGIFSQGRQCLYQNNYLKNTWFSVEMQRTDNEFSYNIINGFGADAVRTLGDDQRILYNQIKNATVFDYNHPEFPQHDDGIQSYVTPLSTSNPIENVQIIGNQIADIADPNLTLPTEIMQGIVDFDGFEENWVVENNLIITHHQHGIALYGAINCKVANNTVIRNPLNLFSPNAFPWIRINPRKANVGGELSTGNLVRNNIMASYRTDNHEPASIDHNTIGNNYANYFEDYQGWNFYLSDNSPALNTGIIEDAPFMDLHQKRRIVDDIDQGCFEKDANLIDLEKPTTPSNITSVQTTETSFNLSWNASEDNTGVAYYEVRMENQKIQTSFASVFISGLEAGSNYEISITAVDHFSNTSDVATFIESTNPLDLLAIYYIPAEQHDQLIKSNNQLMWVGMPFHRIGGYFENFDASAVLPFKLPCLDDGREITAADLTITLDEIVNSPNINIDLYGLAAASTSNVPASAHWQGAYGFDPNGFAIASGYISSQTAIGQVTLNEPQTIRLGDYIQELFSSGASCDDYAFLRLNIGSDDGQDNAYYNIAAADHNNSFEAPLLSIITSGTSALETIEIQNGLTIFPNPSSGKLINLQIQGFDTERTMLVIHNAKGQEVFRKTIEPTDLLSAMKIEHHLDSGTYFVSLLGERKYARATLVVVGK